MKNSSRDKIAKAIAAALDIPPSAYEKAEARYKSLGEWFEKPTSECSKYSPHIYPQGSFRMGTVNRPLNASDSYDLDLGCRLRIGITKALHTQEHLKNLVGRDLEAYRVAQRILRELEEMHRCWRLEYADELNFHMDVVPSIPQDQNQLIQLEESMIKRGAAGNFAGNVARHAGAITDKRDPNYRIITPAWRISNSEGYALWFESRIKLAEQLLHEFAVFSKVAKVDDLPTWKWKSPLQQCVQILKRHRDVMFKDDPEGEPISIILTTLAAEAYKGETDLEDALRGILSDMGNYINARTPRVPNPVNGAEDFADKWHNPKYAQHRLEQKFWSWLEQARADFGILGSLHDAESLVKQASLKFAVSIDANETKSILGISSINIITEPKTHVITGTPAKPWMKG